VGSEQAAAAIDSH